MVALESFCNKHNWLPMVAIYPVAIEKYIVAIIIFNATKDELQHGCSNRAIATNSMVALCIYYNQYMVAKYHKLQRNWWLLLMFYVTKFSLQTYINVM
jgi:hypothetical protein